MTSSEPDEAVGTPGVAATGGSWRSAPFDAIVIALLLGVANWFVSRTDLGWFALNPTPWLLLPLFLGGRYGVLPGLIGSGLAASAILSLNRFGNGTDAIELLGNEPYYFLAILLVGAIASLIHTLVAGPVGQILNRNQFLEKQSNVLTEHLALYRENEACLQQSLLLHGAEVASLTSELHRLFSLETEKTEAGLLGIYQRLNGVEAAAIYRRPKVGRELVRVASNSADDALFPAKLSSDATEIPLASLALSRHTLVSCRHLWETGAPDSPPPETSGPHLVAIPSRDGTALLVIARMSFEQIHWESLARIETMFHWVMAHQDSFQDPTSTEPVTPAALSILPPEAFADRLRLARSAAGRLGLQSRLILFTPATNATQESQAGFVESLQASAGHADTLGAVQNRQGGSYAIALLAPLVSEAAAETRADRILSAMPFGGDSIRYRVVDPANASALDELGVGADPMVNSQPELAT